MEGLAILLLVVALLVLVVVLWVTHKEGEENARNNTQAVVDSINDLTRAFSAGE